MDASSLFPVRPDLEHLAAWRVFLEAHAAVVGVLNDELEAAEGFPLAWYDVLVQLNEAGGTLRMHQLADALLISRSATTRFVDRLEARGLITRQVCDEDRRGMNVVLSEEGLETLRRAAPGHLDGVSRLFTRHLSDEDARCLTEILSRIRDSVCDGRDG
jgi:DNA-binding MarR family transcriptional regulator